MTAGRVAAIVVIVLASAGLAWLSWPRPDTLIRVAQGGVATVTDAYGRTEPLGDTVRVRGAGARRKIRVVNDDTIPHRLAMLSVGAGERTDYTVPPGTFGGSCSAHPAKKRLTFVIQ